MRRSYDHNSKGEQLSKVVQLPAASKLRGFYRRVESDIVEDLVVYVLGETAGTDND
jgi:hypothetical protein